MQVLRRFHIGILLTIILLTGLLIRALFLDRIPQGITTDELNFVLNAKAVVYAGSDISGTWNPLSFSPVPLEFPQAEIPVLLFVPFALLFDMTLLTAHIPGVVYNMTLVLILFAIVKKILDVRIALVVALCASINPWMIFFGRTSYEAPIALMMLFLSVYLCLHRSYIATLASIVPLCLAFYTYSGFKVIMLPFIMIWLFFIWFAYDSKRNGKAYIAVLTGALVILSSFVLNLHNNSSSLRFNEISFIDDVQIAHRTNDQRSLSIVSPLTSVFLNKVTSGIKEKFEVYIGAFSPSSLFFATERTQQFRIWEHGYFYVIDMCLIILGIGYSFVRNRAFGMTLLLTCLIAPLPSVIHGGEITYALRSSIIIPPLIIFTGLGIWYLLTCVRSFVARWFIGASLIACYVLLTANFLFIYFFVNPIVSSEGVGTSQRILSNYLTQASNLPIAVYVITGDPKNIYKHHMVYSNSYLNSTVGSVQDAIADDTFVVDNAHFVRCEKLKGRAGNAIYTAPSGEACEHIPQVDSIGGIPQLKDGGWVYTIYNDIVCANESKRRYPHPITFSMLDISGLDTSSFCNAYIMTRTDREDRE